MDILAWNPLATALITDFAAIPEDHRNYVRIVFTDPSVRTLYPHWDQNARLCVAQLHMEVARDPQDPRVCILSCASSRYRSIHQASRRPIRQRDTAD